MTFWRIIALAISVFAILGASPARADWYEASSDHFVIYADDSKKDIRTFAENLERYHSAMELLTGRKLGKPSPSNRVVIFVVGSGREVRKLAGSGSRNVAGFYIPRAGASRAFVQDIRNRKGGYPHFSTVILLHEYAHHFLLSASRFAMPRWLNEGGAEFFAATSFNKDGSILIGRPAQHRAGELFYADNVPIRELLNYEAFSRDRGNQNDAFYGRSWLLYHFLTFSEERKGQIAAYSRAIIDGKSSIEAGEEAFGDLDQLEKELKAYLRQRRSLTFDLPPDWLTVGDISLRELPEGEAKVLPLRMQSQRGVTEEEAKELVIEVREVAAAYPDDAGVLAALAEAEFDAGNDAEAIAAADKAIALDPSRTNPYVQKGYALFRMAQDAEDQEAAYKKAMRPFTQLNAIENDHPLPLIYYYRSFAERGVEPEENAKHALERAAQLAPFDKGLWLNVAMMQMQEGKIALAKSSLKPLAADPHGGSQVGRAKAILASLDAIEEGTKISLGDLVTEVADSSQASDDDKTGKDGSAED